MRFTKAETPHCSFCHKAEAVVERLIASPSDRNVRICDECLAVCNSILSDKEYPPAPPPQHPGHCLMCDPRTPQLLDTIEQWVLAEAANRQPLVFLGRACRLALSIMRLDSD
jgi:ATP-dependent protease Clp ATPase subunit